MVESKSPYCIKGSSIARCLCFIILGFFTNIFLFLSGGHLLIQRYITFWNARNVIAKAWHVTHSIEQKECRHSLIHQVYSVKQNVLEWLNYHFSRDALKYLSILLRLPIFLKEFTVRSLKNVASYILPFIYCHFL